MNINHLFCIFDRYTLRYVEFMRLLQHIMNGKVIFFTAILFSVVFYITSCSHERLLIDEIPENRITFVVSLLPPHIAEPATRSIVENSADDNYVNEMTILLFSNISPFQYVDYFYIPSSEISDVVVGDPTKKQFTVTIPQGDYQALLIANSEDYIASLYNLSAGTVAGGSTLLTTLTLSQMEDALTFAYNGVWNATPLHADYRSFPMSSMVENLSVPNYIDFLSNPINMGRVLSKVNLKVKSTVTNFLINEILLCNYHSEGYLIPAAGWGSSASVFDPSAVHPYGSVYSDPINGLSYSSMINSNQCVDEIFTCEQAAPANEANFDGVGGWKTGSLCLLIKASGETNSGEIFTNRWFRLDFMDVDLNDGNKLKHVHILRNFKYELEIVGVGNVGYLTDEDAYNNIPDGLIIELIAANEIEDINDITFNGQYQLAVDHSTVVVKGSGIGALKVYTDYSGGWQLTSITSVGNWLTSTDFSQTGTSTANGSGADLVEITALANNTGTIRTATVLLSAGNLRKTVTVIQLPITGGITDNMPVNVNSYIGAFWKSYQTGERLIRINRPTTGTVTAIDGAWMAVVAEGDDWIVLDTTPSTDGGVWSVGGPAKSGNDSGFDIEYKVNSTATMVGGVMPAVSGSAIYFRIGLKNTYQPIPTDPARYGVVLLLAKDYTIIQRIFIRQGETYDYTPGQSSGALWAPYNLGDLVSGSAPLQGDFVDYPTQAGYFYHWGWSISPGQPPLSFHPVHPISSTPANFITTSGYYDYTLDFVCPLGYMLPTGDSGSDASALVSTPSLYGYYADGWFDRREIINSPNSSSLSTVSYYTSSSDTRNDHVAYVGKLFYSTTNYASLFFPATGYRAYNNGNLYDAGVNGYGWTKTAGSSLNNAFAFTMSSAAATQTGYDKVNGFPVRCIKDDRLPPPPATNWATTPWVGTFHRASERGERFIYSGHTGSWTATVVDGTSWIVLDDGGAWSTTRLYNMYVDNIPGYPEINLVGGSATSVSGTGDILFRVGLTGTLPNATSTPRYGRIELTWSGGTSYIYVRQGEAADYLIRPEESINSDGYSNTARPSAVRISPYNLKDPANGAPTTVTTAGVPNVGLSPAGGSFVTYPTQAGSYFRWNYSRQAFAPHYPIGAIGNWTNTQYGNSFWTPEEGEVCPPGYRRPKEAGNNHLAHNTTGGIDGSESRQSLWYVPRAGTTSVTTDNSISGYYADGFFDRRPIINDAVSMGNGDVAYVGRLFTGTNLASLFFPAAGYRSSSDGSLAATGQQGYYWSSSSYSGTDAWRFLVDVAMNATDYATSLRSSGFTIRCVKDTFSGDLEPPSTDTWANY